MRSRSYSSSSSKVTVHSALRAAFYLNDLLYPVINGLNHTWSLAVEEHYYLIWPPVLLLILRFAPRRALSICAGLFLLALVVRIGDISIVGAGEVYHRLDARFTGLMLGSTLAVFVAERHRLGGAARWSPIALVPMFVLMPFNVVHSDPGLSFGVLFTEAATALVILSLVQGEAAFAFLAATPLRFIGRISYGAYLYHCPVMLWMTDRGFVWWSVLLVVLPLTTVFASLSYYYLERPLLGLARRRDTAVRPRSSPRSRQSRRRGEAEAGRRASQTLC